MYNKKYEVMLSVLTILTVIMTATGVSFSYFTNGMIGEKASVTAQTEKIGNVTFDGGADFTTATDIEPDWSESKTFTITAAPSDREQTVYVKMDYVNGMPDLTCSVGEVSEGAKGAITLNADSTSTTVILVEKTFPPSNETRSITYTLTMALPETGENQNESQGKTFEGELYAEFANDYYYNSDNPNGTPIKPNGNV
jgi:hypothetical protein